MFTRLPRGTWRESELCLGRAAPGRPLRRLRDGGVGWRRSVGFGVEGVRTVSGVGVRMRTREPARANRLHGKSAVIKALQSATWLALILKGLGLPWEVDLHPERTAALPCSMR